MSISAVGSSLSSCTGYGVGQMTGSSRSERPDADEIAASIFERDDADGDGLLSLGETPLDEDRFNAIDADGDGYLTREELAEDAKSREQAKGSLSGQLTLLMQGVDSGELAASIVEKDDADGDGLLSFEETPLDEDRFNAIDANGDGFISADELSADMEENMAQGMAPPPAGGPGQGRDAETIVAEDDEDGDGLLSLSETPLDEDMFNSIDANGDGFISADELSAHMEESMAEGMTMPSEGAEAQAASASGASGSSGASSGSSESEEYDAYDLNKDGVVSFDELMQAYEGGDESLKSMFESMGGGVMSTRTRLAMEAYQAQMV